MAVILFDRDKLGAQAATKQVRSASASCISAISTSINNHYEGQHFHTSDRLRGLPLTSHWLGQASAMEATTTAGLLQTFAPCTVAVTVYVPAAWA